MTGNFPPDYFAPDYFAPDYFGGEIDGNAMVAAIAGSSSVTADLTAAGVSASQPLAQGANGGDLWRVYQEILASEQKRSTKRAKRRRRVVAAADVALVEELPSERPLEALVTDLRAERARLDDLAETLDAQRIEAERERIRRKRNNEAALLLLAA